MLPRLMSKKPPIYYGFEIFSCTGTETETDVDKPELTPLNFTVTPAGQPSAATATPTTAVVHSSSSTASSQSNQVANSFSQQHASSSMAINQPNQMLNIAQQSNHITNSIEQTNHLSSTSQSSQMTSSSQSYESIQNGLISAHQQQTRTTMIQHQQQQQQTITQHSSYQQQEHTVSHSEQISRSTGYQAPAVQAVQTVQPAAQGENVQRRATRSRCNSGSNDTVVQGQRFNITNSLKR